MAKKILVISACLSLFPLMAVCQDRGCSVAPADMPAVVSDSHVITCSAKPRTIIISWKLGLEPRAISNTVIYHVDLSGSIESTPHSQTDGYVVDYYSLRKSRMIISSVDLNDAGYVYCCAFDIIAKEKIYCSSKLNVYAERPVFVSNEIDVARGLFTNLACAVTFKGSGVMAVGIMDHGKEGKPRNLSYLDFPNFGLHNITLPYQHVVNITLTTQSENVLPSDVGIQSAFYCMSAFAGSEFLKLTVGIEVDAPVTFAAIVPYSSTKCSERRCRMHEKLVCISNGLPPPTKFVWTLFTDRGQLNVSFVSDYKRSQALTQVSGRSTYECRAVGEFANYSFAAIARFATHVEAFELVLDEYATYESKGSRLEDWFPLTMVAAIYGIIIWIFMLRSATDDVLSW